MALVRFFGLLTLALTALPLYAQADRRDQIKTPGLVLETGAPVGITRGLAFTRDGKNLLAAGEDKVVRQWPIKADGTFDRDARTALRWRTWHEWRGAIYAMALSPDQAEKYVAVGGYGAVPGEIAVLERATGKVVAATTLAPEYAELRAVTTALAFHPKENRLAIGTGLGGVFVWDFLKNSTAVTQLGKHDERPKAGENIVHRLGFTEAGELISNAQDGAILKWTFDGQKPKEVLRTDVPNADVSAYCESAGLLAFGGRDDPKANAVEVRSLDGKTSARLELPKDAIAYALAFHPDGSRLAVGLVYPPENDNAQLPQKCRVWICSIKAGELLRDDEYPLDYFPDALAFSPDGKRLAVSGGSDFSIRFIELKTKKMLDELRSAGAPIWSVGFNSEGTALGFRTKLRGDPSSVNAWGTGDWRAFELKPRSWSKEPAKFAPVEPLETLGGWTVRIASKNSWFARRGDLEFPIPLIYSQEVRPTCYTFAKAADGGVNLAVGHKWGFSLFELTESGVRRIRLGYGHGSEVTALAPSKDHTQLLTAGRDQTISAWSLKSWDHQRELGANFVQDGGQFLVKTVAEGSPAWEAGLSAGDEIALLAVDNVDAKPEEWAAKLLAPVPNKELYFEVNRRGVKDKLKMLTTVRQRPLWKFFPMESGEWVLWRWRDYYYDCSTNGDSAVGWQINGPVGETPTFLKAEQLRKNRHKPEKVLEALALGGFAPEKTIGFDLLPPSVTLRADSDRVVEGQPIAVTVSVKPTDGGAVRQPDSVSVWVNDHKFATWAGEELGAGGFEKTVSIPANVFRSGGANIVAAHATDRRTESGRGEANGLRIAGLPPKTKSKLHGLFLGVQDYRRAPLGPNKELVTDLYFPEEDVRSLREAWQNRAKTGPFESGTAIELLDSQLDDPKAVYDALKKIAIGASADDLIVVYFSGHGWGRPANGIAKYGREAFALLGPKFDLRRYRETGLTSDAMYDALAAIPSRKLLLLDACHSGGATTDSVRAMTPEGRGPPILAAAQADEKAWEIPNYGHGLFTKVLLDALTRDFAVADRNGDGQLDPEELGDYLAKMVPIRLREADVMSKEPAPGRRQTPVIHPRGFQIHPDRDRPVAAKPTPP